MKVEKTEMEKMLLAFEEMKKENNDLKKQFEELTKKTETIEVKSEEIARPEMAWLEERVPFFAIHDGEKYKDDIVVGINGTNWVIQRGKHVKIPRYVYNAIMDSQAQEIEATLQSENLREDFNRKRTNLI